MKMSRSMATCAECNKVFFGIVSQPAARAEVVDLKILRRATILAATPFVREHRAGDLVAGLRFTP